MGFRFEIRRFPKTHLDCMVSWRPLGEPVSPQTPPEKCFTGISPNLGKLGKVPLAPCTFPIGPLWAYRAYSPWLGFVARVIWVPIGSFEAALLIRSF